MIQEVDTNYRLRKEKKENGESMGDELLTTG